MANAKFKDDAINDQDFGDELKTGSTLMHGQYTIDSFLNAGGFGITYSARDSLDRRVVIKECFPGAFCRRSTALVTARSRAHQSELASIVRLFVQEARSMAKLDHPNIVGVHQVFEENNTAYMALDFVEGHDLLEVIENSTLKLTPQETEDILRKILDAISFVHAQGLLHRDISPDNILIDKDKRPVLIDFGAAREQASKKSRVLSALRVVKDGYSPQEFYVTGSEQGPYSDLYALGATFYHLITGKLPPDAQTRLSAVASGEKDPYRPLLNRVATHRKPFLHSIDTALAILPRDRIATAENWIEMLESDTPIPRPRVMSKVLSKPVTPQAAPAQASHQEPKSKKGVLLTSVAVGGILAVIVIASQFDLLSTDTASQTVDAAALPAVVGTGETSTASAPDAAPSAADITAALTGLGNVEAVETQDTASPDVAPAPADVTAALIGLGNGETTETPEAAASDVAPSSADVAAALAGLGNVDTAETQDTASPDVAPAPADVTAALIGLGNGETTETPEAAASDVAPSSADVAAALAGLGNVDTAETPDAASPDVAPVPADITAALIGLGNGETTETPEAAASDVAPSSADITAALTELGNVEVAPVAPDAPSSDAIAALSLDAPTLPTQTTPPDVAAYEPIADAFDADAAPAVPDDVLAASRPVARPDTARPVTASVASAQQTSSPHAWADAAPAPVSGAEAALAALIVENATAPAESNGAPIADATPEAVATAIPTAEAEAGAEDVANAPVADTPGGEVTAPEQQVETAAVATAQPAVIAPEAVPGETFDVPGMSSTWNVLLPDGWTFGAAEGETHVFAVNGQPVTSRESFESALRQNTGIPNSADVKADITLGASAADAITESWDLPVVQQTTMSNGLAFQTKVEDGSWVTTVTALPEGFFGNLLVDDVLFAHMGAGTFFTQRTSLPETLEKIARGEADTSVATIRQGSTFVASLPIAPVGTN